MGSKLAGGGDPTGGGQKGGSTVSQSQPADLRWPRDPFTNIFFGDGGLGLTESGGHRVHRGHTANVSPVRYRGPASPLEASQQPPRQSRPLGQNYIDGPPIHVRVLGSIGEGVEGTGSSDGFDYSLFSA